MRTTPRVPRFSLSFLILSISLTLQLTHSQSQISQQQRAFNDKALTACAQKDDSLLRLLIKDNRLLAKPLVEQLVTSSISAELQSDNTKAQRDRACAATIAQAHQSTFGEQSLVLAVDELAGWTMDQKIKKLRADSLNEKGTQLRGKKESRAEALACYNEALALYTQIGDQRGEAAVLGGLGALHFLNQEYNQSLSVYEKALAARIRVDDRELIGNTYNDIGFSLYWNYFKDYPQALKYLLQAEAIRQEIGDLSNLARTQGRIGTTYEDLGQLPQALEYQRKAADLHRQVGDKDRYATALYDCGRVQRSLGKYTDALTSYQEALAIRQQLGDKRRVADVLNVLGITYKDLGEYELAYQHYEDMLKLKEEAKDTRGVAQGSMNIGVLLRNLDRPEEAAESFRKSLLSFQTLKDTSGIVSTLGNLGLAYFDLGKYDSAETTTREALAIAHRQKNKILEIKNLINLGNTLNFENRLDEGLSIYQQALALSRQTDAPGLVWPSILGIGENQERRKNYSAAYEQYAQALQTIEGIRGAIQSTQYKESFVATQRYVYEAAVHVLTLLHGQKPKGGYDRLAFEYAERGKARAFLDLMAEALAGIREGIDPSLLKQQEELIAQISKTETAIQQEASRTPAGGETMISLKTRLSDLENQFNALKKEIRRANPRYAELQYPEPASLRSVQTTLAKDKTVVLEYLVGDSSSSLWVISRNRHRCFRLPDRKTLEEQVTIARFALQSPQVESWSALTKAGHTLYKHLVAPAARMIAGADRLLIIPDDVLHLLPFEVLMTKPIPEGARREFSELPYLGKAYAISYCASASIARTLVSEDRRRSAQGPISLLAFGDPVFSVPRDAPPGFRSDSAIALKDQLSSPFGRLEHSGTEVRTIAQLFPGNAAKVFMQADATEENAKQSLTTSQYTYVHFATHGSINERKPEFSSIVLTQDADLAEDGFLRAVEIFNLPVRADLVVLSACQTGLGKMVRGEGIVGLTRAFMYAGAPSLLVSLWSVSDVSTGQLMEAFYRNNVSGSLDKVKALQKAKLALIKQRKYSHPFYWAPFVLVGSWK